MATSKIIRPFISAFFFMLLFTSSSAATYKVGDSDGWTVKDDHSFYFHWTEYKEFHVGDSLVFEYDPNFSDVTWVAGALEYEFCDASAPRSVYKTGSDVVTLTEPGFQYFISSAPGQCHAGQKLGVQVVYDPASPVPSLPTVPTINLPEGKIYVVGESRGWTVPIISNFYSKWTEKKHFNVGDSLLFKYDPNSDGVVQINGGIEYAYCDPTSPVAVHKTGHDLIKLTKPGVHYFISSTTGHCFSGLKLSVQVAALPTGPIHVPKKLSPMERFRRWLDTFNRAPHHHL